MYSSVHMADQYGAVGSVIALFLTMGPLQFVLYVVALTLLGYYINKRKKSSNE